MKPGHGTSQSCSCTSCLYHSESERRPSFQRIISDASKIDQLFLGKYIPLRERKLLGKLVKTRAVYDTVRKELLSSSNATISDKTDLRTKKRVAREYDETEKSSAQAILELVDLVDRGNPGLSDCCSCCICDPKGLLAQGAVHKHAHDTHIREHHRHSYHGQGTPSNGSGRRHIHPLHGGSHAMEEMSMIEKQRTTARTRSRKGLRFKAKRIRSVPCTCTFDLTSSIKRQSKALVRKMKRRSQKGTTVMDPAYVSFEEKTRETHKIQKVKELARKSYEKLKESQTRLKQGLEEGARISLKKLKESESLLKRDIEEGAVASLRKMKESDVRIKRAVVGAKSSLKKIKQSKIMCECKENLEAGARKSIETLNKTKNKIKEKVDNVRKSQIEDLRKSINEARYSRVPTESDVKENAEEITFALEKDSITKYREKLKRKHEREAWACEHECDPEECTPEECLRILMRNRARRAKHREHRERRVRKREQRIGESTTDSNVNLQTKEITSDARVGTRRREIRQERKSTYLAEPQTHIKVPTRNKEREIMDKDMMMTAGKKNKGTKREADASRGKGKTKSVKSMTDVTLASPKLEGVASTESVDKKVKKKSRPAAVPSTSSVPREAVQENLPSRSTTSDSSVNRQAVRIGSSFSFNIEFYKDKAVKSPETEQEPAHQVRKKHAEEYDKKNHRGHHARNTIQRHKTSEVRFNKKMKDTKVGGHSLKRCFCTLKIKPQKTRMKVSKSVTKGTSVPKHLKPQTGYSTESIQTKRLRHHQKLLPYECEPGVCIPDECDPFECQKLIQKRNTKLHAATTNTERRSKSASSITNSISDATSRSIYVTPSKVTKIQRERPSQMIDVTPMIQSPKPRRQAVRVGSSFSFNIEFFKETPTNIIQKPTNPERVATTYSKEPRPQKPKTRQNKRDRGVTGAVKERHLRHRHSQKSTSSGKSKYTLTTHSLRRCFCTLKLMPSKGKGRANTHSTSKSSVISRSAQTRKLRRNKDKQPRKLLPYECEPGICIPDNCKPYECLKIIQKRRASRDKQSGTRNRQRSSSSWTTRSASPSKPKRVQSAVVTYKTEIPPRKYKDSVKIKSMPREIKTSPSSPNRQAVRIGSTFSFDIEFFKDKVSPANYAPVKVKYAPPLLPTKPRSIEKNINRNKNNLKERGSQGDRSTKQKSMPIQIDIKKKNALIGAAMKRCFCTLKLVKKGKAKKKPKEMNATGTDTPIFNHKVYPTATKGTKTKREKIKTSPALKPYECEPYVCTPGECDPYECLEIIKRRGRSKEFGTSVDRTKMKSVSSLAQSLSVSSGTGTNNTQLKKRKVAAKAHKQRKKLSQPQNLQNSVNFFPERPSRQAVRIGSSFGFDIEFSKNRNQLVSQNKVIATKEITNSRNIKNTGADAKERSVMSHQVSQVFGGKKKHKATGIKPILKRCFCTLQLRKKDSRQPNNKLIKTISRQPKVYTVSRVTVAETKLITPKKSRGSEFNTRHSFEYTTQKLIEMVSLDTNTRDSLNKSQYKLQYNEGGINPKESSLLLIDNSLIKKSSDNNRTGSASDSSVDVVLSNDCTNSVYNTLTIEDSFNIANMRYSPPARKRTEYPNQNKIFEHESKISCQAANINTFLRKSFYTMNLSTDVRLHKLKPHECEPGVCVPYECDPIECQKLINKRQKATKRSGTERSYKSTSSYSHLSQRQRARNLQSNIQLRSAKTTHAREPVGGISYKTVPNRQRKQMVRVGSTFSFDIEFSKDKSATQKYREGEVPKRQYHSDTRHVKVKHGQTKGTRGPSVTRYNQDSQSGTTMMDRGSSISPILKRCLCTLKLHKKGQQIKLQKKGKHKKRVIRSINQSTMPPTKTRVEVLKAETMTTGQNTKSYKLQPYECEPNVCVPGECNPHECLELIKARNKKYKTRALGTANPESQSTSSITDSRRTRGRNIQSDYHRRKPRDKAANFKDTAKGDTKPTTHLSSDRQVVRIGSSFSFNIEFYKDKSPQFDRYRAAAKAVKAQRTKDKQKPIHKINSISSTSTKLKAHSRESQATAKIGHRASGIAPKLKRCFCTLTLQKQAKKQGKKQALPKQAAMTTQGTKTHAVREVPTLFTRSVMTNQKMGKLKPYECEPYSCVPGQCDPYECNELIKRRLRREFGTSTGQRKTRSMASASSTSRARKVQHDNVNHKTRNRPIQSKDMHLKPIKQRQSINSFSGSPFRQAVRIGSTFSFNIDFSKDKSGTNSVTPILRTERPSFVRKPKSPLKRNNVTGSQQEHRSVRSTESQIENKKRTIGAGVSPLLKRCFCTLTLKNPKKRKPNKRFGHNKNMLDAGSKVEKIYKSTPYPPMRTSQVYRLESYECEPFVCVPGKCDPIECLKRINRRNVRELGTVTGRHRTRSIGNTSTVTPRRAKRIQHNHLVKTAQSTTRSKYPRNIIKPSSTSPHKHVTRIGSNFNVDIEFFKEKSFNGGGAKTETIDEFHRDTHRDAIEHSPNHRPSPTRSIHRKSQRLKNVHHRDSQVLAQNMQSTLTGVTPFLKRCFCTLKLQKSPKRSNAVAKSAATDSKELKVLYPMKADTVDRSTKTKKYKSLRKLEPHECEPGICVPGDCNPHECAKRIKMREMRSRKAGTGKHLGHSISSLTDASTREVCTQSRCPKQCSGYKNRSTGNSQKYIVEERRFKRIDNPLRQAVHISSSFSFNIEFYKNGMAGLANVHDESEVGDYKNKYQHKNTPSKKIRNRGVCSQGICLRNRQLQHGTKTESRGAGIRPLLQKCFCTLKLLRENDHQPISNPKFDAKTNTKTKYRPNDDTVSVGVGTKRKLFDLKSYECEPYVCVPGECDPYECLERIKRRPTKHSGIGTQHVRNRSAATITSKNTKCIETQCYKDPTRCRNTQCYTKSKPMKTSTRREPNYRTHYSNVPPSGEYQQHENRHAVRIGSNFSFDVEFFKDQPPPFMHLPNHNVSPYKPRESRRQTKLRTHVNRGSHQSDKRYNKTQMADVKMDSKGSGVSHMLKRCFCTLKLKNSPEGNRRETKTINYVSLHIEPQPLPLKNLIKGKKLNNKKTPQPPPIPIEDKKKTSTLKPGQLEPQMYIPGQCDPYECLERKKKRGRSYRTMRTHTNGYSQNVSTIANKCAPTCKFKKVQCACKVYEKNNNCNAKVRNTEPKIVEERRFQNIFRNRQAVRFGSNISCNIEFFKDGTSPPRYNCPRTAKDAKLYYCPKTVREKHPVKYNKRNVGISNNVVKFNTCESQAGCVKSKTKGVGQRLKRCFCTLKLQNKIASGHKVVTVRRVTVEDKLNMSPLYRNDLQDKVMKHNYDKNCNQNISNLEVYKQNTGHNEMETILPYIPNKFNKNYSKTVFLENDEIDAKKVTSKKNKKYDAHKMHTTNRKEVKSSSSKTFSIKNIIRRCMQFFTRSKKDTFDTNDIAKQPHGEYVCINPKNIRRHKRIESSRTDVLKTSKSDRQPAFSKLVSVPKKSKSVKMAKESEKDKCHKNCRNYVEPHQKKYSRFQSGDATRNHTNEVVCAYCQVIYGKEMPSHGDNKVEPRNVKNSIGGPFVPKCNECVNKIRETELNVYYNTCNEQAAVKPEEAQKIHEKKVHFRSKQVKKKPNLKKTKQNLNKAELNNECCSCTNDKKVMTKPGNLKKIKETKDSSKSPKDIKNTKDVKKRKAKKSEGLACVQQCAECNQEICGPKVNVSLSNSQDQKNQTRKEKKKKITENNNLQFYSNAKSHNNKPKKSKLTKTKQGADQTKLNDECCSCSKDGKDTAKPPNQKSSKKLKVSEVPKDPVKFNKPIISKKTNYTKKEAPCQKPKKPPPDFICKTKKPCVCCGGARKKLEAGDAQVAKKRGRIQKKETCKDICEVQSKEDAKSMLCKILDKYRCNFKKQPVCDYKPMFQVKLDSGSMAVLNTDEIYDKIMKLKAKRKETEDDVSPEELKLLHGKSCRCCICKSVRHTMHVPKHDTALSMSIKSVSSLLGIGKQPCICGSQICATEFQNLETMKAEKKKMKKQRKPCVCGTKICENEALKVALKDHLITKKGGKQMKKIIKQKTKDRKNMAQKEAKQRKAQKEYLERQKKYKKEDGLRRKMRNKEEKLMDQQVKKYRNTSAWLLAAESLLDIGQLAVKTATGVLRSTGRVIMDPKRTYRMLKDAKQDPGRIVTNVKGAWSDSGVCSSAKRIKNRIGAMMCVTQAKDKLEQYTVTNYLLHMFDKDPKARLLRKKRLIRKREPLDFECSLFMASLRTKPWLGIYYKCPWFYPHCISMLRIVRSFLDVITFLLAVVFWSPCLLCMEICRACMCCTMCTG